VLRGSYASWRVSIDQDW